MTDKNYFKPGSYNFYCDICRQKKKSDELMVQWDNQVVCKSCYDPKHPYLWPRPIVIDGKSVSLARPRPKETFIKNPNDVTGSIWGSKYWNGSNFVPDILWEDWDEFWGGNNSIPFNATNFPLK